MLSPHQGTCMFMLVNPFKVVALLAHNYCFSSWKPIFSELKSEFAYCLIFDEKNCRTVEHILIIYYLLQS